MAVGRGTPHDLGIKGEVSSHCSAPASMHPGQLGVKSDASGSSVAELKRTKLRWSSEPRTKDGGH